MAIQVGHTFFLPKVDNLSRNARDSCLVLLGQFFHSCYLVMQLLGLDSTVAWIG